MMRGRRMGLGAWNEGVRVCRGRWVCCGGECSTSCSMLFVLGDLKILKAG